MKNTFNLKFLLFAVLFISFMHAREENVQFTTEGVESLCKKYSLNLICTQANFHTQIGGRKVLKPSDVITCYIVSYLETLKEVNDSEAQGLKNAWKKNKVNLFQELFQDNKKAIESFNYDESLSKIE